jgi:hypothetical protein
MDFYTIVERAAQLNETAIGYQHKLQKVITTEEHFGVKIKSEENR